MAVRPLLYYITDRTGFPGDEAARRRRLLEKIVEAALAGVDYIQLREKDLSARELETLARDAVSIVRESMHPQGRGSTALLINSRTDVALAVGADGVHLRSDDVSPRNIREIWSRSGSGGQTRAWTRAGPVLGVSCHTFEEVAEAAAQDADFAAFAPVFEKKDALSTPAAGLAQLREASQARIAVLALGGVSLFNARSCLDAGAAGIAGIRLFQENDLEHVVRLLRG